MKKVFNKRTIYCMACALLLANILIVSVKSTIDSYYNYYYYNEKVPANQFLNILNAILEIKPLQVFNNYTGLESGYGFFGVNVSSEFVLVYEVYDNQEKLKEIQTFKMKSDEGDLKFKSINRIFKESLQFPDNSGYDEYLNTILQEIGRHIRERFPIDHSVCLKLYLYDFPSLKNYNQSNASPVLYIVKELKV